MNLPQLTAKIGKAAKKEIGNFSELSMLVKTIDIDKEKGYVLFMTMDLEKEEIRFEAPFPFGRSSTFHYHYFGNNSAAGMQYYLTRDGRSVHYLLKSVYSDLYLVLQKHDLHEKELGSLIIEMDRLKLISLGSKKGKGEVNLDKIKGLSGASLDSKNNIVVDGVTKKSEDFIRYLLNWENKETTFALIVPRVLKKEGGFVVLPQHPDYVTATKREQNLDVSGTRKDKKICYVCKKINDASSALTTKFSRSGINKIFGTTTFNYAKKINKKYFDDNYAICSECFQELLFGEKKISQSFSSRIANERAFILPEGLLDDFNYNQLTELKRGTDLFFEKGLAEKVDVELELSMEEFTKAGGYVVHFVVYRTDGNSVNILETIEDVPTLHIVRIVQTLGKKVGQFIPYIRSMSLGTIYRMIPVRTNKKGEQLDIQRVLSVYQSLFTKVPIEASVLFGYAAEALEKGFKEIRKKKITQYENLGLKPFLPDQEDRYFGQLTTRYLCLLHTCQELGVLDRIIFKDKGVISMEFSGMTSSVQEIEGYLEKHGFDNKPRALFYLGVLLRSVARAQFDKNHKSKPILNKLSFQGMNQREVVWLYQEILEKLHQYDKMTINNEQYMTAFNYYFGALKEEKALTDQEHIFYIMAGYSFYPAKLKEDNESCTTEPPELLETTGN